VAVIAGGLAIAGILAAFTYVSPAQVTKSYNSGNLTVNVLEDSSRKFLAKVENNGPRLESAAAFVVKKGLNSDCEPQGIVVANFKLGNKNGRLVPNPDSIPANGSVTLDSTAANIGQIPPSTETTIYVMRLDPSSLRATDVLHAVQIQQSNSTDLEVFEKCLKESNRGYPVLFKLTDISKESQAYFTVDDGTNKFETAFFLRKDAPDFPAVYWPDSRQNWLQANFTKPSGPAPAWKEPQTLVVDIKTVASGKVQEFAQQIKLSEARLKTASLDFIDVARGNAVPIYPKYWEIDVDLQNKMVS
jgi:hypothetical protein